MSTSTNVMSGVTGILTVGVGGLVAWAKKSLTTILKDAEQIRNQATSDLAQIKNDVAIISAELQQVIVNTKPAPAKAAAAPKKRVAGK